MLGNLSGNALFIAIVLLIVAAFFIIRIARKRSESKGVDQAKTHSIAKSLALAGLIGLALGVLDIFVLSDSLGYTIVLLGILLLIASLDALIADMAQSKGRSWAAFFWLSILFSPVIMWIIAAAISPLAGSATYVAPVAAPSTVVSPDIAKEIEKLGSLKEQGLITKAEFDSKKKELLDRI